MYEQIALTGLLVGACLSPLLTFANLWQIKEWRIDRLREHLRSEGFLRQLFGVTRPLVLAFFFFLGLVGMPSWHWAALGAFLLLGLVQIALRRQPKPVWTMKAMAIVSAGLVLNAAIPAANFQFVIFNFQWVALLPLLQPFIVFIGWLIFLPVDRLLKRRILARARAARAAHPDVMVVGITGSVGKTTTKELLAHILQDKNAAATPEYVNSEIGVARWLAATLQQETLPDILIVEMGAYRPGEIALMCRMAQPQRSIITAIGRQHLALFKSQAALQNAKAEIIASLPPEGTAYLNADNKLCADVQDRTQANVILVGTGGTADLEAYDIEETANGIRFTCNGTAYTCPLHGTHNITNILLAIAVTRDLGVPENEIAKQLRTFQPPSTTFSVSEQNGITVLNDTHNASPSSFQAALGWARNQPAEHCVLLTSGLQELGRDQDNVHSELGSRAAEVCDRVVFLHERNAKYFEKGYGRPVERFSATSAPVPEGSLLLCVGRMSEKVIGQLLPQREQKE